MTDEISKLNTLSGTKKLYKEKTTMINLNEIAFIDEDGFDFNTGESLIRFDVVAYCPNTKQITFAITNQGKISVLNFKVFEDEDGHYIEYGSTYEKIYIDDIQEN